MTRIDGQPFDKIHRPKSGELHSRLALKIARLSDGFRLDRSTWIERRARAAEVAFMTLGCELPGCQLDDPSPYQRDRLGCDL